MSELSEKAAGLHALVPADCPEHESITQMLRAAYLLGASSLIHDIARAAHHRPSQRATAAAVLEAIRVARKEIDELGVDLDIEAAPQ